VLARSRASLARTRRSAASSVLGIERQRLTCFLCFRPAWASANHIATSDRSVRRWRNAMSGPGAQLDGERGAGTCTLVRVGRTTCAPGASVACSAQRRKLCLQRRWSLCDVESSPSAIARYMRGRTRLPSSFEDTLFSFQCRVRGQITLPQNAVTAAGPGVSQ
jgi:hypothetical protein